MKEEEQDIKDSKAIEEKTLNYFKAFIEDSKVISQFIADNDKEPCWDGHLYLYSDGKRDKEHLQGRVPVQIKGTEVTRFVTKGWKYKLEKTDLKAYLHEPTFFIVCQVKKDSKERKLFYRELLPNRVNTLLKDMGPNDTRKTLFHPLTEDLKEFEDQLKVFMSNSKKMVSFADAKPLTMKEAVKQGIKDFSFVAPTKFADKLLGKGKTVKLPGQETTLLTLEISNVTLLLWCVADKEGNCSFGDFFDKTIRITYKMNDGKYANVSPYSYLQLEKKWEKIDNIDYVGLVDAAKEAVKEHEYCYNMANYDVLAMISAADVLEEKDAERSRKLLEEALKLNEWLIENDPKPEMKNVNLVNKIQIVKRQRGVRDDEVVELERMLTEEGIEDSLRMGVNLLLDRQGEAEVIFETLPEEEKKRLQEFPIWRYRSAAIE